MMKVAVLLGGMSGEREVSLQTGKGIVGALLELGHTVAEIDAGKDLAQRLMEEAPDAAFLALHGRYGEDGTVQGLLEILRIPYTGSSVLASAATMDKVVTKALLKDHGIPLVDDVVVEIEEWRENKDIVCQIIKAELEYPVMAKPSSEGSSLGATIVKDESELRVALIKALEYDQRVLVERYIEGRLLTVGILGKKELVLPVLEIKPKREFYDYEAKYTTGESDYEVPANIPPEITQRAQDIAISSYRLLGCEDISRVDMIMAGEGSLFFLEINTIPGMTGTSLIPKAAEVIGISYNDVVATILEGARLKVATGS